MVKNLLLLALPVLFSFTAFSQGEASKWYFGSNAALDFSSGSPVVITGGLSTSEGCSAVSDAAGNILFYTNGVNVWDRTNAIMSNGTGLMGDISSTQSALIVPSTASNSQYYIFTTTADGGPNGFRYSLVDMSLHGGNGDVTTTKNVLLNDSTTEKIAAVKDAAGSGYWIVTHQWGTNAFLSYHLTAPGISAPVISNTGMVHSTSAIQNTYGQMKFNMCGDKLALAIGYQNTVELFDFDSNTGTVSNPLTLSMADHVYGVEFSKSSMFLYVTCYETTAKISQFNISLPTLPLIMASKTPLSTTDDLYGLQIAPNGKIYVARSFGTNFLGVINSPETPGSACNYVDNGVDLDPGGMGVNAALTLPGFMQSYLKIDVTCSVGINEISPDESAIIYPNPTSDNFTLQLKNNQCSQIKVYDHTGRLLEDKTIHSDTFVFGKEYAAGMYLVSCSSGSNVKSYKVIKY
jgi:hypothetical protein